MYFFVPSEGLTKADGNVNSLSAASRTSTGKLEIGVSKR